MWVKIVLICVFGFGRSMTTSFDVGGIVSGNRMGAVPLGPSLGSGELDVEGVCSEPGMTCQNCTHAVTCIMLPVGWLKVPLQECPEGQTCNAHQGRCSTEPVTDCDGQGKDFQHTCEQVGIFPDAYDCKKFHLCSPPEGWPDGRPADHRTALCPRNYMYNPSNAQCSIKLNKGQCSEKPVPVCKEIGQIDVLPHSPNHYYICVVKDGVLYPQVFICPHGWYFWNGSCKPVPAQNVRPDSIPQPSNDNSHQERHNQGPEVNPNIHDTYADLDPSFNTGNNGQNLNNNRDGYGTDANPNQNEERRIDDQVPYKNSNISEVVDHSANKENEGRRPEYTKPSDNIPVPDFRDNVINNFQNNFNEMPEGFTNLDLNVPNSVPQNSDSKKIRFQNNYNQMPNEDTNKGFNDPKLEQEIPNGDREIDGDHPQSTTTRIERFVFSTEKPVVYHPDTFLADRFDLSNYETTYDMIPSQDQDGDYFDNADISL